MADVTISELTQGVPAGNNLLPYSTGTNTLGAPVSAIFQNTSKVGIGTTDPLYNLHLVYNDAEQTNINHGLIIRNTATPGIAHFSVNSSANNCGIRSYNSTHPTKPSYNEIGNWSTEGQLSFVVRSQSRMVIDGNGNIGMGVLSPSNGMKLDVYGSTRVVGGLRLDYSGVNADPYVANIWTQGTLAANSSLSINMNGIAVNYPCAGIWLAFIQTDSPVLNRNNILYKATAMYMGSYMRTLGTNVFNGFTNMYSRDTVSLAITPPNSNDGINFSFTNSYTDSTCTYQIRTVPIMSNFRANT
jgi:hypothetical protein